MKPIGALGDIFRARASRWRNLAAGGIMPSWRPAVGLIAKLLEEIVLKPPYVFLRRKGMVACACSRVRLIGTWRPLALAGGVTTAVCGFGKLAENFFKKVLDRNRRSVNIVDAPFTGN